MSIKVRFFASLKEQVGRTEVIIRSDEVRTVNDVWNRSTSSMLKPENMLSAINMEYADLNAPVNEGDEVAFFPPVTGGAGGN